MNWADDMDRAGIGDTVDADLKPLHPSAVDEAREALYGSLWDHKRKKEAIATFEAAVRAESLDAAGRPDSISFWQARALAAEAELAARADYARTLLDLSERGKHFELRALLRAALEQKP